MSNFDKQNPDVTLALLVGLMTALDPSKGKELNETLRTHNEITRILTDATSSAERFQKHYCEFIDSCKSKYDEKSIETFRDQLHVLLDDSVDKTAVLALRMTEIK